MEEIIKKSPKMTEELLDVMLTNDIFKHDIKLPLQLAEKVRQSPELNGDMIQKMIPIVTNPAIKEVLKNMVSLKQAPEARPSAAAVEEPSQHAHGLKRWLAIRHRHPDEPKPDSDLPPTKHKHGFFHSIAKKLFGRKEDAQDPHPKKGPRH